MDADQAVTFLRGLPHAVETVPWGDNLVYWSGDKAIGGKMFALLNLDKDREPRKSSPVLAFHVGPERYFELLEVESVVPAPYFARSYWMALAHWNVFRRVELESLLKAANASVTERLPRRTRDALSLPRAEQEKLVASRRKLLKS